MAKGVGKAYRNVLLPGPGEALAQLLKSSFLKEGRGAAQNLDSSWSWAQVQGSRDMCEPYVTPTQLCKGNDADDSWEDTVKRRQGCLNKPQHLLVNRWFSQAGSPSSYVLLSWFSWAWALHLALAHERSISRRRCACKIILFPGFPGRTLVSCAPGSFTTLIHALWLATAQGKGVLFSSTAPDLQEALLEHEGFGVLQGWTAQFGDIYLQPILVLQNSYNFFLLQK